MNSYSLVQRRKVANSFLRQPFFFDIFYLILFYFILWHSLLVGVMWSFEINLKSLFSLVLLLVLTPNVDEVPVNPMLDYFENISIVKIIMGVPELSSRFGLAYSRGPVSAGQIIIDKLRPGHNEQRQIIRGQYFQIEARNNAHNQFYSKSEDQTSFTYSSTFQQSLDLNQISFSWIYYCLYIFFINSWDLLI